MKKIITLVSLSVLCLASCRQMAIDEPETTGSLQLSVSNVGDFITVDTKAGDEDAVDLSDLNEFDVVIDGPTKISKKFGELAGQVTELGSGDYTITVTSPLTEPAAFEQPIYQAYDTFTIKAGEVTVLNLTCTPYNCKVTVELTENFKKELATYEVVVNNGLGSLTWTKDATKDDFGEGKAGYFLPRGLEIKVKGHRSIDNTEATTVKYIEDPQPAEHHVIRLDAKVTGQIGGSGDGTPGITITIVTTFTEKDFDIEVDDDVNEEYVDRPDFDGDEGEEEVVLKNEIIWPDNTLFEDYDVYTNSSVAMTIKMPAGIASFVVKVDHAGFQTAVSAMTKGNVPYIDLINDDVFAGYMRGGEQPIDPDHNLPLGDEVRGQTELEFNLTCFIPMLCGVVPGETVPFILEAYDVNGNPLLFSGSFPRITMIVHEGEAPVDPEQPQQ